MSVQAFRRLFTLPRISLRLSTPRLVLPGGPPGGAFGKPRIDVVLEGDLPVEHAGPDHEVAHQVEIGLARREPRVDDAVERLGQRVAENLRTLPVVVAGYEVGGVLTVRPPFVQPQTGPGDAVDEHLHGLG